MVGLRFANPTYFNQNVGTIAAARGLQAAQ